MAVALPLIEKAGAAVAGAAPTAATQKVLVQELGAFAKCLDEVILD